MRRVTCTAKTLTSSEKCQHLSVQALSPNFLTWHAVTHDPAWIEILQGRLAFSEGNVYWLSYRKRQAVNGKGQLVWELKPSPNGALADIPSQTGLAQRHWSSSAIASWKV